MDTRERNVWRHAVVYMAEWREGSFLELEDSLFIIILHQIASKTRQVVLSPWKHSRQDATPFPAEHIHRMAWRLLLVSQLSDGLSGH